MRILITGGAGFIGSHLCDALIASGHSVTVLDDFSTGRHENVAHLEGHPLFELVCADIADEGIVRECVAKADRVYHLASAVGVRLIVEQPVRTIETIVHGTSVVMKACSRYRKPVLITSTSEVYGKSTKVPFSEDDDLVIGPSYRRRWGYACSKALDEFLAMAYWHHSRMPVVIVRLFNTVGPRQSGQYGMVLPRFVQQALKDEPLTVYGDGSQTRCFCHVKDAVGALVKLMELPEARGQVFNVGNREEVSIRELAERVINITGSRSQIRYIPFEEAYGADFEDMQRRVPDLTKIEKAIGYRPRYSLDDIIRDIVEYYANKLGLSLRAGITR
ncbi:MAG: GDP-mannose 4,6-dehydratase [Thermogutta sp.]|uniref:GDP-mannose 4,6-dehydratase n=1 Tax=Thermogutta sp. TaxID=1962930 RepID=UPI0019B0A38F|nr:GDP-mannose 4,6-dehydratase [Thermogutta sp.]MBC7351308.1 GDP-mannose 4,6-dehydratase [Thermogutta sp.]